MNYIDLFAIAVVLLGILVGYNQGFLKSLFNIVNIILSIFIGLLFYGLVSKDIASNPQILPAVIHFSEASELLGGIENEKISVYDKSVEEMEKIIDNLSLPYPQAKLLKKNIQDQAFASKSVDKLGDYMGLTIGNMTLNYISFVIVFGVSFLILTVLISLGDYVFEYPVLRSMDSVAGGIGGFIQGLLILNVIFLAIPLILAFLPFDELIKFVNGSTFSKLYYYKNILTKIITGII
ncbi:MAG: CvpA family protein [Eubacteriales bacterium]